MGFVDTALAQDATLKLGGRVMLDYGVVNINNPDVSVNASEVRRARLFAIGTYGDSVDYKFEFNHTTGGDIDVTDAFVKFKPEALPFSVKVGHFYTHNTLDEQTSSRFISTIERSALTDAFELNRRLGISVGSTGDRYTLNAGVFADSVNGAAFDQAGNAVAVRATFLPFKTDTTIAHIGASWRYRNGSDATDSAVNDGLRYRQRPYVNATTSDNTDSVLPGGRIVSTSRFAKSDNFIGVEGAVIHDNMWVAGEYAFLKANGAGANADASFGGGYVEGGIIFGGRRTYKGSGGSFNRTKVDNPVGSGGMGALALVARYDTLDLNGGDQKGQLDTIVLGADWMPTKQTRLRLNYFDADATNGAAESANGLVARLGFDF